MDGNKAVEVKLTNKEKYYTITGIIEQAKAIFDFKYSQTTDNSKLFRAMRRRIERALKDKKSYGEGTRNRKYARKDVYHLLSVDLYNYFLKISKQKNEADSAIYDGKPKASEYQQAMNRAIESAAIREKNLATYLTDIPRRQEEMLEFMIRMREGTLNEDDIQLHEDSQVDAMKRAIFFEFLYEHFFDSLIDFNEDQYRQDLRNKPEMDDSVPDDTGILAAQRLADNHNYYHAKLTPEAIKNHLYKLSAK